MDSNKDSLDNFLDNLNEEKTVDITSPFYQLMEKQAKEFELFGQRLKSEVQNSYQELIKLQHEQPIKSVQTDDEISIDIQKNINEITKLGDSQSELIDALKARVEELEIDSIVKDQDIKNLRQDIKNFLEFNKLKITKGKSVDIVNGKRDNEGVTWADSIYDEELNWWNNVEDENLVNNSKSAYAESSNSSNNLSSFLSQIDQIHIKVRGIIARRESLGKVVREKHFRVLERDFTSDDLFKYTKSVNYNSLIDDDNKRILDNFLIKRLTNEDLNREDKIHARIQEIIVRRENFDKKIRERHFKALAREFTNNDLIQYTKSENYNSLNDNTKRMLNNFLTKKWANEQEDKPFESKSAQQIHNKIQEVIAQKEILGKNVKRRNLKFLTREFTNIDLLQYTKSENFHSLNKKVKKIIHDFVYVESVNNNLATGISLTNIFLSQLSQEDQEVIPNLHSQIQQIIIQKEQLGFKVRLKHFKTLEMSFTINDFIQYTKTNQFNSLDGNSKRLLNLLIYEILAREFKQQNLTLSQNFDEYVKRGVIPELPSGYNNYTMYKESDLFNKLNKILKARVNKLVKLEGILNAQE